MTLPVTPRMKIDALLAIALAYQAELKVIAPNTTGDIFFCRVCFNRIEPEQEIDWDHGVAHGLGGAHHYTNIRPLHRACHRKKTSGTKATTAGSDIHMIRKARRIAKGGKRRRGPAMKSKPFPKFLGGFRITRRAKA